MSLFSTPNSFACLPMALLKSALTWFKKNSSNIVRVVRANITNLVYFLNFTNLYHTLSCKKYKTGLIISSVNPMVEAKTTLPVVKYETVNVVKVPRNLYDIVFNVCLNSEFSRWMFTFFIVCLPFSFAHGF